jgi:hypothetical protein
MHAGGAMLKRTARLKTRKRLQRGRRRVGAAAVARIKAGGVLAKGRPSATRAEYDAIREALLVRSGGRCEVVLDDVRCGSLGTERCHAKNRSQGSEDSVAAIYWGCRWHNEQQMAAYADGRLIVSPNPAARPAPFDFTVITKAHKWASA